MMKWTAVGTFLKFSLLTAAADAVLPIFGMETLERLGAGCGVAFLSVYFLPMLVRISRVNLSDIGIQTSDTGQPGT